MGRLRGSLEEFLGRKETPVSQINVEDLTATVEQLAGGKQIIRVVQREPKPEGPDSKQDLAADFQEAVQSEADAPPWLLKVYGKIRGDNEEAARTHEALMDKQTVAIVNYVTKILPTYEKNFEMEGIVDDYSSAERRFVEKVQAIHKDRKDRTPGWHQAYADACADLRALLVKVEDLVTAMTNDSELTSSENGAQFIKQKSELLVVLRILVHNFERRLETSFEANSSEKKQDDIIVVSPNEKVSRTIQVDDAVPKDEL